MGDYQLPERAEVTFVAVRHETGDELEALGEGCRVAVAEELRAQAAYYHDEAMRERKRSLRLADHAPKWQHEVAIASYQELAAVANRLCTRAAYLDPEGATR
jgi:hypothetical protein